MTATLNITAISKIGEIFPLISESSLVVLDLDNTVFTSTTYIGGAQWESDLRKKFMEEGFSEQETFDKAENIWRRAQKDTNMRLTDEDFTSLLTNDYNCIGCTARSPETINTTMRQLEEVGVSFAHEESFTVSEPASAYFHQGIIFCEGSPKDRALFAWLNDKSQTPTRIIMVDDSLKHVEDIGKTCQMNNVEFFGFLYQCETIVRN